MKRIILPVVFILLLVTNVKAQPGCFTADKVKGCAPLTITITNCSGSVDAATFYHYGEGPATNITDDKTYKYDTAGIYTVTQIIPISGGSHYEVKTNYIEVVDARKPSFTLNVCEGGDITLTITDNIDNSYILNTPGLVNLVPPFTPIPHTYSDYLIKNINITPFNGCGFATDTNFYPINTVVKPDITSVIVNNQHVSAGQITLNFNARIEQRYALQQSINNNSSWISIDTLKNISGPQSVVLNNLNTVANQYCYRLIAYDDCGVQVPSEEICSITNTVGPPANNQNDISWTSHFAGGVLNYNVYKDNNPVPITTTNATFYSDLAVSCGVNYCYQVVTNLTQNTLAGNPLQSISASQCLTAISTNTPATITDLNSSVSGTSVRLNWTTPASSVTEYRISRSVNGGAFVPYTTYTSPLTNTYTDNGTSIPPNEYCYMVTYKDQCGNFSLPVNSTCPMVLEVVTDNSTTLTNYLSWSSYSGVGVASYLVQKLDENDNVVSSVNVGLTTNYTDVLPGTDVKIVRYRVQVVPSGPTSQIPYSNIYEIKFEGEIHLPNAFTPNSDGVNDEFMAKGKFIKEYKLTVFNRWGEVVYSTDRLDAGWNGMYQGIQALPDAYAYLVEAKDFWEKSITRRGSVTLLK